MLLKSQKGFSMLELMVILGLAGMLAMISVSLQQQVQKVTKSVESSLNLNGFMAKLGSVLADPRACTENFSQLEFDADSNIAKINGVINQYFFDRNTLAEVLDVRQKGNREYSAPFSKEYFLKDAFFKKVGENSVELNVTFQRKEDGDKSLIKEITRSIRIFAVLDQNYLVSCKSDLTGLEEEIVAETCQQITGTNIEPGENCEIHAYEQVNCPVDTYLTGFVADGKIIKPVCSDIDLSTSDSSLSKEYRISGTGSILGNDPNVFEIEDSFNQESPCPDPWNGTAGSGGERFNQQLDEFEISASLGIGCL